MGSRLELQSILEEYIGNRHVYYRPPESMRLEYPAIVYSRTGKDVKKANNKSYMVTNRYKLTVISKREEDLLIAKLIDLPMSNLETEYESNNLYHTVFTVYY